MMSGRDSVYLPAHPMKEYLTTVLALACAALIVFLFMMKGGDNKQHGQDVAAITDYSNRLDSASTQITIYQGTILSLSNRLDASQSASLTFSNQLTAAQSVVALNADQITNLTRHVAKVESENQTLNRSVTDLTNQLSGLMKQITLTESRLDQANKNYALLENRLRRDVAERVVVERKFYNPSELQAQLQYVRKHPAKVISADSIYADLGVEVTSNAFHVISSN